MKKKEIHTFTKAFLESLKPAEKGKRRFIYDKTRPELRICITDRGTKSFQIQKRLNDKVIKITLGKYPAITISHAREMTLSHLSSIAHGINPNLQKQEIKEETTLGMLFREYMERYSKPQKKSWQYDAKEIPRFLHHWFNRPLSSISRQEILRLHEKIGKNNGKYQANRILERIKGMYNKAKEWGLEYGNPANGIKKFKEIKRDRFLYPDELRRFFKAVDESKSENVKNFIYLALLTGARKSNIFSMRWQDIDFKNKLWRIPDTKNGDPLVVSLPDKAIEILNSISESRINEYVFPSKKSKSGHLEEPKKEFKAICKQAKIEDLRIHDLRRTFASYQAIQGSSLLIIAKSVGHRDLQSTQIYSRLSQDPVRESVTKATTTIWNLGHGN